MVACKELGYADGFVRRVDRDSIDEQPAPAWLGAVDCAGGEASLAACDNSAFGDVVGCGDTIRLFCYNEGAPLLATACRSPAHSTPHEAYLPGECE